MLRLINNNKKSALVIALFLFALNGFAFYAYSNNVKKYYNNIWKAQNYLLENNYDNAAKFYKKALNIDTNLFFETDLINAAFSAYKTNDTALYQFCKTKFLKEPSNKKIEIIFQDGNAFNLKDSTYNITSPVDNFIDSLLKVDQEIRFAKYKFGKQLYCEDNKKEIIKIDSSNYITILRNLPKLNTRLNLYSQRKLDVLIIHFLQWGFSSILDSLKQNVLSGLLDNRVYSQWCDDIITNFPLFWGYKYQFDGIYGTKNPFLVGDYAIYYFNHRKDKKLVSVRKINQNRASIYLNPISEHFKAVAYCYLKLNDYFYYNNSVDVFSFGSLREDNLQAETNIENCRKKNNKIFVYTKR
jgi:hypothetical protein